MVDAATLAVYRERLSLDLLTHACWAFTQRLLLVLGVCGLQISCGHDRS